MDHFVHGRKKIRKNTRELKNLFQSNTHLFCKFGHFRTSFYLVGDTLGVADQKNIYLEQAEWPKVPINFNT